MKAIEQEMLRAIFNNKEHWSKDNTSIEREDLPDEVSHYHVYLHGNHIATVAHKHMRTLSVIADENTLQDYPTVTTKSRLRALGVNVYTKAYTTYLDGEPIN